MAPLSVQVLRKTAGSFGWSSKICEEVPCVSRLFSKVEKGILGMTPRASSDVFERFSPKLVELPEGYSLEPVEKTGKRLFAKGYNKATGIDGSKILTFLNSIGIKFSTVEVIKDPKGRMLGGFSYQKINGKLNIGHMFLDSSQRGTSKGYKLLVAMGERIKGVAEKNNITLITCQSLDKPELIRLYENAGFKVIKKQLGNVFYEAQTGNLGKTFLERRPQQRSH